jgi:Mg-chelatase subunit ChlD
MYVKTIVKRLQAIEARLDHALSVSIELRADGSGYIQIDCEQGERFDSIKDIARALDAEMEHIEDWLQE